MIVYHLRSSSIRALTITLLAMMLFGSCRTLVFLRMTDTHWAMLDRPTAHSFSLSPDGSELAWLDYWDDRFNIYLLSLDEEDSEPERLTSHSDGSVHEFTWIAPGVIHLSRDIGGSERYVNEIIGSGLTSSTLQEAFSGVTRFFDTLPLEPDVLLAEVRSSDAEADSNRPAGAYRINIQTGTQELVVEGSEELGSFISDQHGTVRYARSGESGEKTIWIRDRGTETFRELLRVGSSDTFLTRGYDAERGVVIAASNIGLDRVSLVEIDAEDGQLLRVLADHPVVDIDEVITPHSWDGPAVLSYEHEQPGQIYPNGRLSDFANAVAQRFPDQAYRVSEVLHNGDVLFRVFDRIMTQGVYVYRAAQDEIVLGMDLSGGIDPDIFAQQHGISYEARDGRTIHGYLTLPPRVARPAARDLPLVLHVHGGPWSRDSWGFDYYNQLFAARGYGVLQVNYRGSTGYGRDHLRAGYQQFGRAMQDDLTDAVHWAVDEGIADPDRIAIAGASYGGYATLAGITFTPELYAAGISIVGISDLPALYEDSSVTDLADNPGSRAGWEERVGDPVDDADMLRSVSPVYHADQVQAPVMIVHGENDPRVPLEQSLDMVSALREHNKVVEYHGRADEGHGFSNWNNIFELFVRIDDFLREHMPPRQR